MSTFVFPKHPDTEVVALQRRVEHHLVDGFRQFPPSIYGRLTFEREPPHPESALGLVRGYCNQLSGSIHKRVMWMAVAERGTVNDRLHCHVFLWCHSLRWKVHLCDYLWKYGDTELDAYIPGWNAEVYMAHKIARGEVWACSRQLAKRLGPFLSPAAA